MCPSELRPDRTGKSRLARGCYVPVDDRERLAARCAAILNAVTTDSTIVLTTAAQLRGLWLPILPEDVHVATTEFGVRGRAMTRTRRPEFVAHRYQLTASDREVVFGIPVPTLPVLWVQLARVLSLPDLVAAGDSALRMGTSFDDLKAVVARFTGYRGARLARGALPLLDSRSESRPESHLRLAVAGPDLPVFDVNVNVYRRDGGWLARPDLSLEAARLALEYQGEEHGTVSRMRKDLTRFADLRREGWLVLPYGPVEVFGRPDEIHAEVRVEVRRRAPQLLCHE